MVLRTCFGIRLLTMSMRTCSLFNSVHGAHMRKTKLKSTHCSSSHALEDVSNTLRTTALTAETITARRISQAARLPIQVLAASIARVAGSNVLRRASSALTSSPPPVAWTLDRLVAGTGEFILL